MKLNLFTQNPYQQQKKTQLKSTIKLALLKKQPAWWPNLEFRGSISTKLLAL